MDFLVSVRERRDRFRGNYSCNEPDRLVSKITSLPLIRAFSRFDKTWIESSYDSVVDDEISIWFGLVFVLVITKFVFVKF